MHVYNMYMYMYDLHAREGPINVIIMTLYYLLYIGVQ